MAIQYSGNVQSTTFVTSTKQDIINNLGAAMVTAGWTTIAGGSGTTAWKLQSATTPQNYAVRMSMKDNGGACVNFSLESSDGLVVGTNAATTAGGYLITGGTYKVVLSQYQVFAYVTPLSAVSRTFLSFGVPYVPPILTSFLKRVAWMHSNAQTDTDTVNRSSFRTGLTADPIASVSGCQVLLNSSIWSNNQTNGSSTGSLTLVSFVGNNVFGDPMYKWADGSSFFVDPLIAWGLVFGSEPKYNGQLWDAIISTEAYTADYNTTFDTHNWTALTNAAVNPQGGMRGTLLLATS